MSRTKIKHVDECFNSCQELGNLRCAYNEYLILSFVYKMKIDADTLVVT